MKSRRLTILCMAVIALVGTPRAWHEAGKLLATVQRKAQVKFWSMVLQPGGRKSAGLELVAAAQPLGTEPASNCALERTQWRGDQASGNSKAGRRTNPASSQPKARAQRQARSAPASHAGLIAKALKAEDEDSRAERLRHSRSISKSQPSSWDTERIPSPLIQQDAAFPRPPASESNALRFVMIPAMNPAGSAFVGKETIVQFKLLKKSFEENKLNRQKGRLLKMRNADFGLRI